MILLLVSGVISRNPRNFSGHLFRNSQGRFFFHIMASLAEMERGLTVERTCTGLEVARQLELKDRRKRQMTDSKIESAKKLFANGVPPRDVVKDVQR